LDALVGHSGYVGSSLLRQRGFDRLFRSTDIETIRGQTFDLVVCAGVPAQKWIADRDPDADLANIRRLADHLAGMTTDRLVLISTVDVYPDSRGVDEATPIDAVVATPYGRNRRWLETFVAERFARALIVRLPGLVGPGLRKNALFDFRNDNNLHLIDARGVYQFYPMVNLWADLKTALAADLPLVNFAAEPLSVEEAARDGFGLDFANTVEGRTPAVYDLRTRHAGLFGGAGDYLYSKRETLTAIRAYAQSEPGSKPAA
jgi:hypothetical protein